MESLRYPIRRNCQDPVWYLSHTTPPPIKIGLPSLNHLSTYVTPSVLQLWDNCLYRINPKGLVILEEGKIIWILRQNIKSLNARSFTSSLNLHAFFSIYLSNTQCLKAVLSLLLHYLDLKPFLYEIFPEPPRKLPCLLFGQWFPWIADWPVWRKKSRWLSRPSHMDSSPVLGSLSLSSFSLSSLAFRPFAGTIIMTFKLHFPYLWTFLLNIFYL